MSAAAHALFAKLTTSYPRARQAVQDLRKAEVLPGTIGQLPIEGCAPGDGSLGLLQQWLAL